MKYLDAAWFLEMEGRRYPLKKIRVLLALYLAWALRKGLGGEIHTVDNKESYDRLRAAGISPLQYYHCCDDKLTDEDFNKEGNLFSKEYLRELYFEDYVRALKRFQPETLFDVDDTWENYDYLAALIDRRYVNWKSGKPLKRRWWQFWM